MKLATLLVESVPYVGTLAAQFHSQGRIMQDPKSEKLDRKGNFYKILNEYLDRKIQREKDKLVEKYFDINSQENLLKSFTANNAEVVPPRKK